MDQEDYKDKIEANIDNLSAEIAKAREHRLLEQEYIRRTSNGNNLLKLKIEQIRKLIDDLVNQHMNTKKVTDRKVDENDEMLEQINLYMRHITTLEEQNRELDNELDKFVISDNEVRHKLMDRERSPLKMADLYERRLEEGLEQESPPAFRVKSPPTFKVNQGKQLFTSNSQFSDVYSDAPAIALQRCISKSQYSQSKDSEQEPVRQ